MKRMVITGATGTLGSELIRRYHATWEIHAQGRNADRLLKLQLRHPKIHLILGDLRCHGLRRAVASSHMVIHTAAQKYVDLAELAARKGCEQFIFISTDKASAPGNVYGTTKYLAENLILELASCHPATRFTICRFGNIFGSNGSVVRLWLDAQRRQQESIQVTDPEMTRFMFGVDEAAAAVDFALKHGRSGDIIIPKMGSVRLQQIIELFEGFRVEVVGKRPGEKTHESLYVDGEIRNGRETDRYYVLNRNAPASLPPIRLDSSTAKPVDPQQLRAWFDQVRQAG
jgi:FlaA1/EpsC-like NDP-sugar epimerase